MSCSLNLQFTPRISSSWHSLKVANLTERIPTQFIFANEQLTRWKFENDLAWDILKSKSKGDPFKGFLEEHTASHVVDQDQDLRKSCSSERKLPIFPPFTVHLKLGSQARGIDMFKTLRDFRVLMRIEKLASHVQGGYISEYKHAEALESATRVYANETSLWPQLWMITNVPIARMFKLTKCKTSTYLVRDDNQVMINQPSPQTQERSLSIQRTQTLFLRASFCLVDFELSLSSPPPPNYINHTHKERHFRQPRVRQIRFRVWTPSLRWIGVERWTLCLCSVKIQRDRTLQDFN